MTTIIATIKCAVDNGEKDYKKKTASEKIFTGRGFQIISALFWFGSLIAAIGGTTMQIVGVYRNCICYAGANNWWNINKINPAVNLASDTQDARNSSVYWIWMGSTATVFMAVNCYIGWWYQRLIRHRFTDAVKAMYMPPSEDNSPNGDVNPEVDDEDEVALPSGPGRDSAEQALLSQQDQAHTWAERTTEDITEHLHTDQSNSRRGSRSRDISSESGAFRVSAHPPTITVSDGSVGDEIEHLLRPTRD